MSDLDEREEEAERLAATNFRGMLSAEEILRFWDRNPDWAPGGRFSDEFYGGGDATAPSHLTGYLILGYAALVTVVLVWSWL